MNTKKKNNQLTGIAAGTQAGTSAIVASSSSDMAVANGSREISNGSSAAGQTNGNSISGNAVAEQWLCSLAAVAVVILALP